MAAVGNVIWFIFGGAILALGWLIIAGIFAITIIGLPIARACFEFAKLAALPFGKEIIRDTELYGRENVSGIKKTISIILNIIWFPIGLIFTIIFFIAGIVSFITIIGIPVGIVYIRMGKFVLFPIGARVVSKKQAYAIAVANEIEKRNVSNGESTLQEKDEAALINENKKFKYRKGLSHEKVTNRWGYFFVAPFIIVFCIFNLWPTLYTFILSFTDLKGLQTTFNFNGFTNYVKLVKDQYFWGALGNTMIIWTFNFIPQLGLALLLSIWLSDVRLNLTGKGLFRAVIYMPNLLTAVSVALLFRSIFGYNAHVTSPANQFLYSLGIQATKIDPITGGTVREAIDFFRSVAFSRGLVAFIQWWMWYGYTMIILMAGITTIPISLYESASIDGANSSQTTWYITLPLLRPIMLYILITSMIGGMQMFDIPFQLTDMLGAPNYKIRTTTMYQYNMALGRGPNDYAYGAAISVGIFIVTIFLALIIFFFLQDRSEIKKNKGGAV